ncbi:hypothetical protein N0V87_002618 [Didymella glomerata]|uniref:Uncharacterized protein n=1 Tax=Didymella glomerata TaxID=749621 RepID=A0A9W8X3Z8_9PLEO|nr:hypothetical protein N0V87_002618 [Didymella glomerata]
MPPTTRLPTVEFRSLLLAPIRVRLRTLHTFVRPQCAPVVVRCAATCLAQRRSLHLYKMARAKTALGSHKVLDFDRYEVRSPGESKHRVNLVRWEKGQDWNKNFIVVKENLSLEELYEHVSPGNFIYQADQLSKKLEGNLEELQDQKIAAQNNNYAIGVAKEKKWHGPDQISKKTKQNAIRDGEQMGPLKNIILLLSNPVSYKHLSLDRAYQFIELGSPVEFRIRLCNSATAMKKKVMGPNPELVPWMMDHFPHVRPDFILKAMPEGTIYIVDPVTDGRMVQFVLGKRVKQGPKLDLTTRLFRVKTAVEKSLPRNPMAQRYMFRKVKHRDGKIFDGEQVRPVTEEEKAQQKKLIEKAAKGTRSLTIREPQREATSKESTGLRLNKMAEIDELKSYPKSPKAPKYKHQRGKKK